MSFVFFSVSFFSSSTFAFLENKLYCDVANNYVKIFLSKNDLYSCQNYLSTLDATLVLIRRDMLNVQKYLDAGTNSIYWQSVYDNLEYRFDSFQVIRANILYRVLEFEDNLFVILKKLLVNKLFVYKSDLIMKLTAFEKVPHLSDSQILLRDDLQKQMNVIIWISDSENLENLFSYLPWYFYIRKQIVWK